MKWFIVIFRFIRSHPLCTLLAVPPASIIHSRARTQTTFIFHLLYNIHAQIIIDIIICIGIFCPLSLGIVHWHAVCIRVCACARSIFYPNEHHSKIVSYLCHHHHHQHHLDDHHYICNTLGIVSFRIIAVVLLSFHIDRP